MRSFITCLTFLLAGLALGACTTSAPEGVLPREPVPPPPSLTGSVARPAAQRAGMPAQQRRTLAVPPRLTTPRP